ncbi:MAG TPA: carbon storage regulator CsrA [Methylomusa anaerophila]|uniref:Translational regulator CsrA n=1 Tax=Methylomusa anaerophila TaxID=1930071 RepID=A0A348AKU7_9FIRM|nr:carbon storage regulator CsrA [Methylomusa anaerophila]BBB91695.1 carbon storage regulator [Methylomusa anaerophila]HML88571.1 carbon storage regulator CsrA [Methylomusa anaerophila]
MLALTRKTGERIIIGDTITLTIVEIKGESVRVAIDAPKDIKIYRGEIYQAIIDENKKAAQEGPNLEILNGIKNIKT